MRLRFCFHRWSLVDFRGIAAPIFHERCAKCGKERVWRVGY